MAYRRYNYIPDLLLQGVGRIFGYRYQEQTIELNHGQHEIQIDTDFTPDRVWFSIDDSGNLPVCLGNVDKVGCCVIDEGFVLYADVASTSCKIRWFASLSSRKPKHRRKSHR